LELLKALGPAADDFVVAGAQAMKFVLEKPVQRRISVFQSKDEPEGTGKARMMMAPLWVDL
jgi:hypothetical protein